MIKNDLTRTFIDEIFSKPPKRNFKTNKTLFNHIDEIWVLI